MYFYLHSTQANDIPKLPILYILHLYTYYAIHMNLNYGIFQQIITKFVFHNIDQLNLRKLLFRLKVPEKSQNWWNANIVILV